MFFNLLIHVVEACLSNSSISRAFFIMSDLKIASESSSKIAFSIATKISLFCLLYFSFSASLFILKTFLLSKSFNNPLLKITLSPISFISLTEIIGLPVVASFRYYVATAQFEFLSSVNFSKVIPFALQIAPR